MRDELNNTETSLSTSGVATLAAKLVEGDNAENLVYLRQGRITAVSIGSVTTKISATVNNQTVANIVCTSGWKPVVNDGVWILDTGSGRWLAIGGSSRQQQIGAENIASGTIQSPISIGAITADNLTLTGSETIRNTAADAYMTWYNGGTRIGYIQGIGSGQIYINAENPGTLRLRGGGGCYLDNGIANYQVTQGVTGNRVVCTDGNGYIFGNYINMTADVVGSWPAWYAGTNGDNYMRWYTRLHSSHISGGDLSLDGQIATTKQSGSWYYTGAFYSNAQPNGGGAIAAISLHPGNVAGQMRMAYNVPIYHFGNADSGDYYEIRAAVCTDVSSQRYKQDIRPWPPVQALPTDAIEARVTQEDALSVLRQLDVVTYRRIEENILTDTPNTQRRNTALQRLNNYKESQNAAPYTLPIHVCSIENCGHTPESPCARVVNWQRGHIGYIAEQVENIFPQAVSLDEEMMPVALSGMAMAALNTSSIQQVDRQLTAATEDNNRRITALEKRVAQIASYPPLAQYLKNLPA